jgi:hypothetical protein
MCLANTRPPPPPLHPQQKNGLVQVTSGAKNCHTQQRPKNEFRIILDRSVVKRCAIGDSTDSAVIAVLPAVALARHIDDSEALPSCRR